MLFRLTLTSLTAAVTAEQQYNFLSRCEKDSIQYIVVIVKALSQRALLSTQRLQTLFVRILVTTLLNKSSVFFI